MIPRVALVPLACAALLVPLAGRAASAGGADLVVVGISVPMPAAG
jgi:hypothetical protein